MLGFTFNVIKAIIPNNKLKKQFDELFIIIKMKIIYFKN